jgi:ribosomal protein S18 acetylase RimI-like enzyme
MTCVSDCTFVNIDQKYIFISSLWVKPKNRGKNEGTRMILSAAQYAMSKGIPLIRLDDMSNRYRMIGNIYRQVGFEYEDDDGCEMSGRASYISVQCKKRLNT